MLLNKHPTGNISGRVHTLPFLSIDALIWHSRSCYRSLSCHLIKISTVYARQSNVKCILIIFSYLSWRRLGPAVRTFLVAPTTRVTLLLLLMSEMNLWVRSELCWGWNSLSWHGFHGHWQITCRERAQRPPEHGKYFLGRKREAQWSPSTLNTITNKSACMHLIRMRIMWQNMRGTWRTEFSCCPYYYFLFVISELVSNPG